eukprot:5982557-Pyramimonas_sp.AAC.1
MNLSGQLLNSPKVLARTCMPSYMVRLGGGKFTAKLIQITSLMCVYCRPAKVGRAQQLLHPPDARR